MPKLSGNKGEWSEIYAFLRLLEIKKLYAADAELNKKDDMFYNIINIIRTEPIGTLEFRINRTEDTITVFNTSDSTELLTLPCSEFKNAADRLYCEIIETNASAFADERGNLFFEIMRIADEKQPQIIFLENVANLTEHDNGKTFNRIHNELSERNYYIRYIIADAFNYGIPQHRTRTYIVAFKDFDMCNKFQFPKEQSLKKHIFDIIDRSVKADDSFYLKENSVQYQKMNATITDENQIYRFSDYGVQKSKDGISFTLKANMGTWYNRVPIIKDNFGIRTITPQECLAEQHPIC